MTTVLHVLEDLDRTPDAAAVAAEALGDHLTVLLTRRLRAYLLVRAAAGPDSSATRLAARALDRACEDALAFEQDGLAPAPPGWRRRRKGK